MRVVIAWWELAGTGHTAASLREFLREEAVGTWSAYEGLLLKTWISDPERGRWGAVQVWESAEAAEQPLSRRAAEVIGAPPAERLSFDVEATAVGVNGPAALAGLGLALGGGA